MKGLLRRFKSFRRSTAEGGTTESGENKDNNALGVESRLKFKELPPAAMKVFKSSNLSEDLALEHWDIFLNCLYYCTPKRTFPKRPTPVLDTYKPLPQNDQRKHAIEEVPTESDTNNDKQEVVTNAESKTDENEDKVKDKGKNSFDGKVTVDKTEVLPNNGKTEDDVGPSKNKEPELDVDPHRNIQTPSKDSTLSNQHEENSSRAQRSSSLFETSNDEPRTVGKVNDETNEGKDGQNEVKARKRKSRKKQFTQEELQKMVREENPKDLYVNFREIGKGSYGKVYIATPKNNASSDKEPSTKSASKTLRSKSKEKVEKSPPKTVRGSIDKDHDTYINNKVAIKHMKRNWQEDADNIANEIAILDSCHHVNVVNYITSYLHQNQIWMVMEYCDAGTLKQLLVVEMSEGQIANILGQVLEGLEYLHSQNRIHRDIKSSNILLNMNGDVKIADLGLCVEGEGEHSGMAGSKYWMAPEMIKRQPYTTKVDIWSVGALSMEMAEGVAPYHAFKPLKALFFTATRGAPTLKKGNKWSEEFKDFLRHCFEVEASKRPSAAELLKHPFLSRACSRKDLIKALKLVFLMRVTAGF